LLGFEFFAVFFECLPTRFEILTFGFEAFRFVLEALGTLLRYRGRCNDRRKIGERLFCERFVDRFVPFELLLQFEGCDQRFLREGVFVLDDDLGNGGVLVVAEVLVDVRLLVGFLAFGLELIKRRGLTDPETPPPRRSVRTRNTAISTRERSVASAISRSTTDTHSPRYENVGPSGAVYTTEQTAIYIIISSLNSRKL
jgi:hypothetical protein